MPAWATLVMLSFLAAPGSVRASSYSVTLQPDATQTKDAWLREDAPTALHGSNGDLRLKSTTNNLNRYTVVQIPINALGSVTVLQSWLRLSQSAGSHVVPIESRAYPLTENWSESAVCWANRLGGQLWVTPGGTHQSTWTDRQMVSSATNGSTLSWQVGPMVNAWVQGDLNNDGILLDADRTGPTREAVFISSESGVAASRPALTVYVTDEAPSLRSGWAEIQPRTVRTGAVNVSLTLWLDVDATSDTKTGNATGFDALTLTHNGALAITGVSQMTVGGVPLPPDSVTWTESGTATDFRFPNVQILGQVQIKLKATILAPPSSSGVDLSVVVDDTTTPGAWAQALWPGNADRAAGNGDNLVLTVTALPPSSIDLTPNALTLVERSCSDSVFSVTGKDPLGNQFPVTPDSIQVTPASIGTVALDGRFCATAAGTARVIAFYDVLTDTSIVTVTPALVP